MAAPTIPGLAIDKPPAPGLKIIELIAENVKRIEAVEIRPDGNLVEITGKNGQGKTSVLDAIWWALAGAGAVQSEPIRRGAKEALIRLDLGEFLVTRSFKTGEAGMTTSLSVANREGAVYRTPQALIDSFLGALSLDPLAFCKMDAKQQFITLRAFVPGFDFDAMEADNSKDFNARTDLNREAKRQRALSERMTTPNEPDLPKEPIDEAAIVAEIERVVRENGEIDLRRERRERAIADVDAKNLRAAEIDNQVAALQAQIAELQHQAEVLRGQAVTLRDLADELQGRLDAAPPLPDPVNPDPIRNQLNKAKTINSRLQVVRDRDRLRDEAAETERQANALTVRMATRTQEAVTAIAAAEMPVPGLALTPEGKVLMAGLPFDQASDADQLRASIAIAMALNPKLRVVRVRDGSLLDVDAMKLLAEMADAADCQVWIERVATDSPVGFEMVAGKVRQREPAEEAAGA